MFVFVFLFSDVLSSGAAAGVGVGVVGGGIDPRGWCGACTCACDDGCRGEAAGVA